MTTRRRGFTLLEMLAALAIAALLGLGLVQLVLSSMRDSVGQQAALHQQRMAQAAAKYLAANYADLARLATDTIPVAVSVDQLKSAGLLPATQEAANAFGQTPCLLVLQPTAGKLEALLVTEGGPAPIPQKELPYVASLADAGGGFIAYETPLAAQGAFGAWRVPPDQLGRYLAASCSGTPAVAGHLASALFHDGSVAADFVYRDAVPNHPELNRMTTPLHMAAVAVENDASDARCVAGDAGTQGRIAVDAGGRVLSCQAGTWKAQGSGSWKDPVAAFTDLPMDPAANATGDVRMVTALSRGFTWNGSAWDPLAIDENGDLRVPGTVTADTVALQQVVAKNDACAPDGALARDNTGLTLYCRSGSWRSFLETRVTTQAYANTFHVGPTDPAMSSLVDLTTLPGTRPLLMTASGRCVSSTGTKNASVTVELLSASGTTLGFQGTCEAHTTWPDDTASDEFYTSLVKLPENTTALRISMTGGTTPAQGDGADLQLVLLNSE